jgi:hypothetical protein
VTIAANVVAFIAGQRRVLEDLEKFVETPEYLRLLAAAGPTPGDQDLELWLAQFLIEPAPGLKGLPIHVLSEPDGVHRVEQYLQWLSAVLCS